jgi:hypothetical protein
VSPRSQPARPGAWRRVCAGVSVGRSFLGAVVTLKKDMDVALQLPCSLSTHLTPIPGAIDGLLLIICPGVGRRRPLAVEKVASS